MHFNKLNNIIGWVVFAISTLVYILTVEPTASYWDCGEFIAVSYKLMVPHPPGAPFYLLLSRIFSFLAFGDELQVAFWINMVSVLSSSFTILFLFLTISMLSVKLLRIKSVNDISAGQTITILGAAATGALAYTFSDSFWFSAAEAEVYALSSFFTALVVWAILKWELIEDESKANRWLIFIAYMVGLSIGVHLLNLVTIPVLVLIYYFKKYKTPTKWGIVSAVMISGAIIILINYIIIPGLPSLAGSFEIFFINTLGLPFGSGALFVGLSMIAGLVWGIFYSVKKQKAILNTSLLGLAFILIGYSSYAIVIIRSNYNTPINENDPSDVMSFVKYLKREQYGSRPLLKGQYYTAKVIGSEEGEKVYVKGKEKYEVAERKLSYKYDPTHTTILPRMYSNSPRHVARYREVTGLKKGEKPSFVDNMVFMFKNQIGWMYMRYFLWNFAGREGDWQDANWLSIADALDEVPDQIRNNAARNNFFMIPLILGIVGLFFQYSKSKREFSVIAALFFLTGIALIIYLNMPPIEPRERDYIFVGSYYAFAIWIGFSVLAFGEFLGKVASEKGRAAIATIIGLIAPVIMAIQGWDDHDRSNRYFSVDSAKNFLASVAPNGILFTGGDNDTFPLWYAQAVEGFRTDVRAAVLSYYNTDWYIGQMMRQVHESEPLPFTLTKENYRQGGFNDYLPFEDLNIKTLNVNQFLSLLKSGDKRLKLYPTANVVPSRTFSIPVNKEKVRKLGIVPPEFDSLITDNMVFSLKKGKKALEKKDLAILDNLASTDWERPIYVNNTSMQQINFDLSPWAIQEGNAYRIIPVKNPNPNKSFVNVEVMYENMMNKFHFRGLDNPDVYYTEDYRNFVLNNRSSFNTLTEALLDRGDVERAKEVLLYNLNTITDEGVSYDYTTAGTVPYLYSVGEDERARQIAQLMGDRAIEMLEYLTTYSNKGGLDYEIRTNMVTLNILQRALYENGEQELAEKYKKAYGALLRKGNF